MKNVKSIESARDKDGIEDLDPEFNEVIDDLELDENL